MKPAGADCNLRCDYCFYLRKGDLYPGTARHRMSEKTLRVVLQRYFETSQPIYSMVWQGGEPTLMGEKFFRRVVNLQKEIAPAGARIANAIQTNATSVREDLAAHLGRYRFLAGCSIDGPADLHDAHRLTKTGRGSHKKAVSGMNTLRRHGVPVNGVVLVSAANVGSAQRVYRHLLEQGLRHLQFIPCVEFDARGRPLPYTITGEQWGSFLLSVFEQWYRAHLGSVSIRNFESVMARMAGVAETECRFCSRCDQYLVVEHNGDVYPCDFFVDRAHLLGNVSDHSFEQMRASEGYAEFMDRKGRVPEACTRCSFLPLCMGDCPKFRIGSGDGGVSWLCRGWTRFFDEAGERLAFLVRSAGFQVSFDVCVSKEEPGSGK
jgi:uncharacterized protein